MHLCLVFFFIATVYGISRISEPHMKAISFAQAIEGRKLNGSVIKEIEVPSEGICRLACVEEDKCQSYNFGSTSQAGRFVCQLSNSDRFVGLVNFTEDNDFKYRGMQSICESPGGSTLCSDKKICIPDYSKDSFKCNCDIGYAGIPCELMNSCLKLFQNGFKYSGVYHIIPDGGKPMQVLCDMTTDGGGWTVFQRRLDGSVNFIRGWESYKNGFGDLNGEFWLGNDNLHRLTTADDVKLRVDLEDFDGDIRYAEYATFNVADDGDKYRLLIGGYNGTAGDSMAEGTGMQFSTKDADNDLYSDFHCAKMLKGSWWHKHCTHANLNGVYHGGPYSRLHRDGVRWFTFKGHFYSLKRTEMKLKPKP